MRVDIKLFRTQLMIQRISEFYGQVFLFLSSIMDWIMEKRRKKLLKSFSESLGDVFEKDLERIVRRAARIRILAEQSSRAELQFVRHKVESLSQGVEDMRLGSTGLARERAERQHGEERLHLREARIETYQQEEHSRQRRLGFKLKPLLEENLCGEQNRQFSVEMSKTLQVEKHRETATAQQPLKGTSIYHIISIEMFLLTRVTF